MLEISLRQMSALNGDTEARFVRRVVDFLCTHFADANHADLDELIAEVVHVIERSKTYGFTTEQDCMTFILATKGLGAEFDLQSEVANFLLGGHTSDEKALFLDAMTLACRGR